MHLSVIYYSVNYVVNVIEDLLLYLIILKVCIYYKLIIILWHIMWKVIRPTECEPIKQLNYV